MVMTIKERSSKDVRKRRRNKHSNLSIYTCIEQGLTTSKISQKLGLSKSTVSYHIKNLKASGAISKIGYGVWKTHKYDIGEVRKIAARTPPPFITEQSPKRLKREVRGHGFRFLVKLPKLVRWSERRTWMQKKGVEFKPIPYGESVGLRGHRVKLFSRSLDIYFSKDWSLYAESAEVSWKYALLELKSILTAFQNLFNIELGNRVEWNVCRQHYALVKNALAKDYLLKKEKLQVFDADGKLWMLIDNSHNLEECEQVNTKTSKKDTDKVVQPFFNDLRDNNPPTLSEMMVLIKKVTEQNLETASGLNAVVELLKPKKPVKEDESLERPDYFG